MKHSSNVTPDACAKHSAESNKSLSHLELLPTWIIIATIVSLHMLTNNRFGFYRDELQFLSEAQHLDWGFVECPPLTPFIARISTSIFGLSLIGLRTFSVLSQALILFLTAQITKALGGKCLAITVAVLSIGSSVFSIFDGTVFEYTTFDYLWWVIIAYCTIKLMNAESSCWWLAIGIIEGIGFLTKYSIVFYLMGIFIGMLFTHERRHYLNRWFWGGQAIALIIALPNILWLSHNGFITLDFLHSIHSRDIVNGSTNDFLPEQLLSSINPFATPLFIAGIISFMRNQRYRLLGWMYLIPLTLFIFMRGRSYYLAPAYPMLVAMGAVICERWLHTPVSCNSLTAKARQRRNQAAKLIPAPVRLRRTCICSIFIIGMIAWGAWACTVIIPLRTQGWLRKAALDNSETLRDEFGWDNLVRTLASIRDSLPSNQQVHMGILVRNYGEYGAVAVLGPAYRLPTPISTINSAWLRGYPSPSPAKLIVVGFGDDEVSSLFTGCKIVAKNNRTEGLTNEESKSYNNIYLCERPNSPWPIFWKYSPHFQ